MAPVIDIHAHYFPQRVLKELGEKYPKMKVEVARKGSTVELEMGKFRYQGRVDAGFFGIEKTIEAMDRQRLEKRILSFMPFTLFYEFDEKSAVEATKRCNDFAADIVERHSDRIACMAVVPLHSQEAPDELRRAVKDLGLTGVEIGSNVAGRNLDEKDFRSFFQAANSLGTPIFVHPLYVVAAERLKNYYLRNLVGNPMDTTIAAASMIFGGLLEEFDGLKVILAHAGGFLPYQIGRLEHGYEVRQEPKAVIKKPPSEYFKRLYFDTITHDTRALRFLIEMAGAEHVVLGSDYPFDMAYSDPRGYVEGLGEAADVTEKILGLTSEHLFFG